MNYKKKMKRVLLNFFHVFYARVFCFEYIICVLWQSAVSIKLITNKISPRNKIKRQHMVKYLLRSV